MIANITLVYMVAGLSSRFGGKIKQFAKVGPNNTTLIQYSLHQALPGGFSKIVFIVGNMTENPFKEMFGDNYNGLPVYYAKQTFDTNLRDKPWGTVDAICSAKQYLDCPFVVCNGDDIYGSDSFKLLVNHLKNSNESATIGYVLNDVLPNEGSTNRGIFAVDNLMYVTQIKEMIGIEKNKLKEFNLNRNDLCSMNIFGLQANVLDYLDEALSLFKINNEGNKKIECYLPVELSNLIQNNNMKMKLYSTKDKRMGITNPQDEEIVKKQIEELEKNKF